MPQKIDLMKKFIEKSHVAILFSASITKLLLAIPNKKPIIHPEIRLKIKIMNKLKDSSFHKQPAYPVNK